MVFKSSIGNPNPLTPSQLKILVSCHKPSILPASEYLLPIHVGAANSNLDLSMQRDDRVNDSPCDNISEKNASFCELTAMYWAWKNIKSLYPGLEYIGMNHYRRYFAFGKRKAFDDKIVLSTEEAGNYSFNIDAVTELVRNDGLIVAKKTVYSYPLAIDYSCWNLSKDLRVLYDVITDISPECEDAFIDQMCFSNSFSMYNMFIMNWGDFDAYCHWLFKVLFEVESRIDTTCYTSNYARIYGYMAERLLNVWIHQTKPVEKVVQSPIYFYGSEGQSSTPRLFARRVRAKIAYMFIRPISRKAGSAFFRYPEI